VFCRREIQLLIRPNKSLHPTANLLGVEGVVTISHAQRLSLRFGRSVELYVRQNMKNLMITISALATVLHSSCVFSPKIDQDLLGMCQSIKCPTSRSKFVAHFSLRDEMREAPSITSGMRGGKITEREFWRLDSGNTIKAHDSIYIGPVAATKGSIDCSLNELLREENLPITKLKEVDGFVITSNGGDILYSSYAKKNVVEQVAASDR